MQALILDQIPMPIQVNGKVRGVLQIDANLSQDEIVELAKQTPEIAKYLTGNIVKVIYINKKILNIIVK